MRIGYSELIIIATAAIGLFSLLARRKDAQRSSWPTCVFVPIIIFMAIPMGVTAPDPMRPFRFVIFALVLSRWVVALVRRERNRGWIFYIVLLVVVQFSIDPIAAVFTPKQ